MFKTCGGNFLLQILFLITASGACFALEPGRAVNQYAHRSFSVKEGLPVSTINSVTQSKDGYLWLATEEGVVRFDGKKFVVFNKQNLPALQTNSIAVVAAAADGSVWFGTMGSGAVRWHNGQAEVFKVSNGLPSDEITAIYEAKDGSLWFGTVKGGISHYENGSFTNYTSEELAQATVWNFGETNDGSLWIGTNRLPQRFKNNEFKIYGKNDGVTVTSSSGLRVDSQNRVWMSGAYGVNVWENETVTDYTARLGVKNEIVFTVFEDKDKNLWFGTNSGGLLRYTNNEATRMTVADGLSSDIIVGFYEDREGSLWINSESGGLDQFYDAAFTAVTTKQGLLSNSVSSLMESRNGGFWIANDKGLNFLHNGQIKTFTRRDGLSSDTNGVLLETRDGSIWISTLGKGVDRFTNGKFENFNSRHGIPERHTLAIYEDRDGVMWLGTIIGLLRWQGDDKKILTVKDGLLDDLIQVIVPAVDGTLWIGTDRGLQKFDGQQFTNFTVDNGLPDNRIRGVYEDENKITWIYTDGGLARLDQNGQIKVVTSKNGLFRDSIHTLLPDDKGNFWMSSSAGIFKTSKSQLEQFMRGEIEKVDCVVYGVADGMKTQEANGGIGNSPPGWKAKDSKLWFATEGGVVFVNPNNLYENNFAPNVAVEKVFFDEKLQDWRDKLNVPAGTNRLDFNFTALSFRASDKIRFQYQLAGYDKDWHEADNDKRQISYTNLPPGDYVFRVRAANENGVWNETGASLPLSIAPRFYQTWWFYALSIISCGAFAFVLYKLRLRQIKQRFAIVLAERTRIAREIHDTLAQNLLATTLQLEAAEANLDAEAQPALQRHLAQARLLASEGLKETRNSISALRELPAQAAERCLEDELEKFAQEAAARANLKLQFKVIGKPSKMPDLIEHNFFRIGQEAINNTVKHAAADNLKVELAYVGKKVRLQVADDGKGFECNGSQPTNSKKSSYGLTGLRERAKIIGADFAVESQPGQGTTVTVTIRNNGFRDSKN